MNTTTMIIIGIIAVLAGVGFYFYNKYRKESYEKFFKQVRENAKQVPKSKKNSFLLMMFNETLNTPAKEAKSGKVPARLNNPKYIEIQMLNMSKVLKDTTNVTDKKTKRALEMLKQYQAWEEEQKGKKTA